MLAWKMEAKQKNKFNKKYPSINQHRNYYN